jgi:hypothetical protein
MACQDVTIQSASGMSMVAEAPAPIAGPPPPLIHLDHHGDVRVAYVDSRGDMCVVAYRPSFGPRLRRVAGSEVLPDAMDIDVEQISATLYSLGKLDELTLDEFVEKYLDRRDELAFRALRGEMLTPSEAIVLQMLNSALERLLPKSEPLPAHVNDAIMEVHRLLGD